MRMEKEIRCKHCNKLLAKGEIINIEIKCPRCKTMNVRINKNSNFDCQEQQSEFFYDKK